MTPVGSFVIGEDHPCLPGHFPGHPVVPGVVSLDRTLRLILAAHGGRAAGLPSVKFIRPVLPGQTVMVAYAPAGEAHVSFVCTVDGCSVARGSLAVAQ